MPPRDPDDLLPLTPAIFHILLALAGGECHGYAIMQQVSDLTEGQTHLGPGTHSLRLDESVAGLRTGLYFLRLEQAGQNSGTRAVVTR